MTIYKLPNHDYIDPRIKCIVYHSITDKVGIYVHNNVWACWYDLNKENSLEYSNLPYIDAVFIIDEIKKIKLKHLLLQ